MDMSVSGSVEIDERRRRAAAPDAWQAGGGQDTRPAYLAVSARRARITTDKMNAAVARGPRRGAARPAPAVART
ncbi:hypothetical protein, partial [Burkholderia glumae]|uniref:hypothetical protein n=1 Tax=Burkholderia glumae TaxID=337 RepID=UPI0019D6C626